MRIISLNKFKIAVTAFVSAFFMGACGQTKTNSKPMANEQTTNNNIDTATFGAGCFWCVEAVFQQLNGVLSINSGYTGGSVKNPSYREVCSGTTGHAEVCQITYDKTKV